MNNRLTFTSREVQTAVRLYFPGELAKHSVSEGTKAVTKYNAAQAGEGEGEYEDVKEEEVEGKDNEKKGSIAQNRAGLTFPVMKIHQICKEKLRCQIGIGGSVYLAAVLEYITAEILELAGNNAKELQTKRITPRHIGFAIRGDEELDKLLPGVIAGSGVVPHIHKSLVRKFAGVGLDDDEENIENQTSTGDTEKKVTFDEFVFGGVVPDASTANTGFTFGGATPFGGTTAIGGTTTFGATSFGATAFGGFDPDLPAGSGFGVGTGFSFGGSTAFSGTTGFGTGFSFGGYGFGAHPATDNKSGFT